VTASPEGAPRSGSDRRAGRDGATALLCWMFFLSGASALVFETLWFRQAGLALGNSVWASSLVLAAFMFGLAAGNAATARFGHRIRRPVRFYALLEIAVGASGLALVHLLPELTPRLAPWLRTELDAPLVLNGLRLGVAFSLLLVPSVAMGATLPVLVAALVRRDPHFARVLGRLYGWNTLGAVAGVALGEALLIEWLGIRGAGLAAAGANGVAAMVALGLAGAVDTRPAAPESARAGAADAGAPAWLLAAFTSGAILLALEVVWFRFLQLFVSGTEAAFAGMLGIVLAGIGGGGLLAARWVSRRPEAYRHLPALALASGGVGVATYAGFQAVLAGAPAGTGSFRQAAAFEIALHPAVALGLPLMLPVSLLSGVMFTLLGDGLERRLKRPPRAAGLLTLANTTGAAAGSLLAGFALLPGLGIERSCWLLSAAYGLVALAVVAGGLRPRSRREWLGVGAAGALFAAAMAAFPSGLMERTYLRVPIEYFEAQADERPVAIREGLTETIVYLRKDRFGGPLYHRLLTNGHSMSSTSVLDLRYMKLFVYLPVALHPDPRRALLISYGVGGTAKALTDTAGFERIDVVDTSRDILEMSSIVYPDPSEHPLEDPRVRVYVEDGRFFLQVSEERYDLITGEPPPPQLAGIVNLYTREFFDLVRGRLAEGGIASYWLPVHSLLRSDARAIVRAFCEVFPDCSLWTGSGFDWILLGSRDGIEPVSEAHLGRLWRDPRVGADLRALAVERPGQLGALFLEDAAQLRARVADTPPLVDDRPKRLSGEREPREGRVAFRSWLDAEAARERFARSEWVARVWPEALRQRTLPYFEVQARLNRRVAFPSAAGLARELREVRAALAETPLRTLPLWLLGSSVREQALARGVDPARVESRAVLHYKLGVGALARRQYAAAAARFARSQQESAWNPRVVAYRALALCLDGRSAAGRVLVAQLADPGLPGDPAAAAVLRPVCAATGR